MRDENGYQLLDAGYGRKLERFGPYTIARPCSQAVWRPLNDERSWNHADASFSRDQENKWIKSKELPTEWNIEVEDIWFRIFPTDFGHLGIFPEQAPTWRWLQDYIRKKKKEREEISVLNLFAYSGGATIAALKGGASVCHLDASKGMVNWAKQNVALNNIEKAPVRWIVDDVIKFLTREQKRGHRYDGIILDPPTFGRGPDGELFKIEEVIVPLLTQCRQLLSAQPLFILFSCHTAGFSPLVMQHLMQQVMGKKGGTIEVGEMILNAEPPIYSVPSGTYAKWVLEE